MKKFIARIICYIKKRHTKQTGLDKFKRSHTDPFKEKKKFIRRFYIRARFVAPIRFITSEIRHAIFKLKNRKKRINIQRWKNATSHTYYCLLCRQELIKYKNHMICINPECSNTTKCNLDGK